SMIRVASAMADALSRARSCIARRCERLGACACRAGLSRRRFLSAPANNRMAIRQLHAVGPQPRLFAGRDVCVAMLALPDLELLSQDRQEDGLLSPVCFGTTSIHHDVPHLLVQMDRWSSWPV